MTNTLIAISYIAIFFCFVYFAAVYGPHWGEGKDRKALSPEMRLGCRLAAPGVCGLLPLVFWMVNLHHPQFEQAILIIGMFTMPCMITILLLFSYWAKQGRHKAWKDWHAYAWPHMTSVNGYVCGAGLALGSAIVLLSPLETRSYTLLAAIIGGTAYCFRQIDRYLEEKVTIAILRDAFAVPSVSEH